MFAKVKTQNHAHSVTGSISIHGLYQKSSRRSQGDRTTTQDHQTISQTLPHYLTITIVPVGAGNA